jgi:sarcosine oxidase delta subunit
LLARIAVRAKKSSSPTAVLQRWLHAFGCGRWVNALRDTTTHEFLKIYLLGEGPG